MSAAEYIHPDWISAWRWIKRLRSRKVGIEGGDPVVIYDGWSPGAPNGYSGPRVLDRKNRPWIIVRFERYEKRKLFGGWETNTRVWAVREPVA